MSYYSRFDEIMADKKPLYIEIETLPAGQSNGIKKKTCSARNSILFFSLLLETKDLIAVAARFVKLFYLLNVILLVINQLSSPCPLHCGWNTPKWNCGRRGIMSRRASQLRRL